MEPPNETGFEQKTPSKLSTVFIIILILIIVAGSLSWLALVLKNKGIFTNLFVIGLQQNVVKTNKTSWKIYHNEVLGIEFSYPETWGEVSTSPDNITDLNTLMNGGGNHSHLINIYFSKKSNLMITLWDGFLNAIDDFYAYVGTPDEMSSLRNSGNICQYHISKHSWRPTSKTSELQNSCKDEIKQSFIELIEDFSNANFSPPIGLLYTYSLRDFTFEKAGNTRFPYTMIQYEVAGLLQQKTPITYQQFMKDKSDKIDDSEFRSFVRSFKSIPTVLHEKTENEILLSDDENIKLVKVYYNLLAKNKYQEAFSYLINPAQSETEFTSEQSNIHDQIIKEIKKINGNSVEVLLTIQLHNSPTETYRKVFEIKSGKIQVILEEKINGDISTFNNMRAYASERGLKSVIVLQNDGVETIIESREHSASDLWSATFYSPHISPKGNYLTYNTIYYESSSNSIYDIPNKKILGKTGFEGEFNSSETLYFVCGFNDMSGEAAALIYSLPKFTVKTNLLELYPDLSKYWDYKCSNNEKTNTEVFEFSKIENGTTTRKIYMFNSLTGEPLQLNNSL
jgi:hypothetical protein